MKDWKDQKVTVLGLGRSGISAATYLAKRGASVFLSDSAPADPDKEKQAAELKKLKVKIELGGHTDEAINFSDLIIASPGIPPSANILQQARKLGKEIICDVELAFRETATPIIGVTGTNGKSTTTALISHLLTGAGFNAPACGNFGVPILSQLDVKPDYLVVELSSYQLEYSPTLAPKIAVWLNLTPDHLSWHGGLDAYIQAKQKVFTNQTRDQFAVLNHDDPVVAKCQHKAELFPFSVTSDLVDVVQGAFLNKEYLAYRIDGATHLLCADHELQIRGKHNLENALAAISVAALLNISAAEIERLLRSFSALEHRLEYIATIDGVAFYNDSKATNVDSTIKALESFPNEKVVLIAGGRDKGTPLETLVAEAKKYAAAVILLGEARERFAQAFQTGGFQQVHLVEGLSEAIALGLKLKQGPVVLSPACASFDMFKDYEERGRVFKDLVRARLEKLAPSV